MLNKVLNKEISVKELIEKVSHREFVDFVHYLLKKNETPLKEKYSFLMDVITEYSKLPYELHNVVLVVLFQHYQNQETFILLKKHYEKAGKFKEMIQLVDYYLTITDNQNLKLSLNKETAVFYKEILLEPSIALEYFNNALLISPEDKEVIDHIEDISLAQDNWKQILQNFEERVNQENDPVLKAMINVNIAKIHINNSQDITKAKEVLKEAMISYPKNEDIPLLMRRVFVDYNNIDEIIDFLVELFKKTTDEEYRLAYSELLKYLFSDARVVKKKGFTVYKNLVLLEPTNKELFLNAVEYATENNKYEEFLEMSEELLKQRLPKDYQLFLVNFLADFSFEYLGDVEKAEGFAKQSQRLDPKNFKFDYIYFEYYKMTGNTRKVIEILNKKLFSVNDNSEKVDIYLEIASVAEATNNTFKAIDSYKSILKLDPSNKQAKEALKRVYRSGEKWRVLTGMLKDEIKELSKDENNVDEIVSVYEELIDITINKTKQDPTTFYKSLLAIAPSNTQAFGFLLEKNEKMKRWNEVIKLINQRAEAIDNKYEKIELYFQITDIYNEKLKKPLEATVYYEKILDLEPNNGDALSQLKATYEKSKRWDKLYDVLLKEVDLSESNDSKIVLLEELYSFAETNLKKDSSYLETILSKILELDEMNSFGLKNSLILAEKNNNIEEQYNILSRLNVLEGTNDILLKLAKVTDLLHKDEEAIENYLLLLQENPENKEILKNTVNVYMRNNQFAEIDQLFSDYKDWDLYYESILEIIKKSSDFIDVNKEYSLKAIHLAEEFLDRERTLKSLVAYNKKFADDISIIEKIQTIYKDMGLTEKLVEATKEKFKLVKTKDEKFEIYNELTGIYQEAKLFPELMDNEKTKFLLNNDFSIIDNLTSKINRESDYRALTEIMVELQERLDDDYVLENLYTRSISLYNEIDEYKKSKDIYKKLLSLNKKEKYVDELLELATLLDDYETIVEAYELKLEYLSEDEKLKQLYEMANISLTQLNNKELAVKYLKEILTIKSDHIDSLDMLLKIYQLDNNFDEKIKILNQKAELDESNKKEFYFEIAKTFYYNKKDINNFTIFAQKTFELESNKEKLDVALSVFEETYHLPLADLLSDNYEKGEFYEEKRTLLEKILKKGNLNKEHSFKFKSDLADLLENKFNNYNLSYDLKKELFLEDPSNNHLLNDLERISKKKDDFSDLIAILRKLKDSVSDKMVRINVLARLGKLYGKYLNEPQTAQQLYNEILKEDSSNLTILTSLEDIYKDSENYDMLYDILIKKHKLLKSDEDKTNNKIAMAKVTGFYFGKMDEALEQLDMLLAIDETNFDVYNAKKEFYTKLEKNDLIIKTLEEMSLLDYNDPDKYLSVITELGEFYSTEKSPQVALDYYLGIHDTLSEELREKVRESLFTLLEKNPELVLENREKLIPFFTNRKIWNNLINYYSLIVNSVETDEEKEENYLNIYAIYREHLNLKDDEYSILLNILSHTKENGKALSKISILQSEINIKNDILIKDLEEVASKKTDNWEIYNKISNLYLESGDEENSEIFKVKAFKANPSNDDLFNELLNKYQEKEDFLSVKSIYLSRSEADSLDEDEKVLLLMEVASIDSDYLNDENESLKTYERIYKINKSTDIFVQLEEKYTEKSRWDDLKSLYETSIEISDNEEDKQLFRGQIVNLYVNKFHDFNSAASLLEEMIKTSPTVSENYNKLEQIYVHLEKYEELDKLLQLRFDSIDDDEEKELTLYKKVINAKDKLKSLDITLDSLDKILKINPFNEKALLQLETMLNEKELIPPVSKILGPAYESAGKWEELVELYEVMLENSDDENLEILSKLSDVYKNNLGMFEDSLVHSLKYFEIKPNDEDMLENIEGLISVTDKHADFVKSIDLVLNKIESEKSKVESENLKDETSVVIDIDDNEIDSAIDSFGETEEVIEIEMEGLTSEKLLGVTEEVILQEENVNIMPNEDLDNDLEYKLLLKKAEISEFNIEDKSVVISTLFKLKDKEPTKLEWYEKLVNYLSETGRNKELIEVSKEQLNYIKDEDEKLAILYKISEIYKNNLKDLPETVRTYKEIIKQDPLNGMVLDELEVVYEDTKDKNLKFEVLEILEKIYPVMSDWDKYVSLLKDKLAFTEDKKDLFIEIASKSQKELYNPDEAFEYYDKAFKLSPTEDIAESIFTLTDETGNFEKFVDIMEENISKITDQPLKERVRRKLGDIYFEFLNEPDAAIEHFTLLTDYKTDLDILKKLEMIYQEKEDFKNLEKVYLDLDNILEDNSDKIENLKKLANIQEFELKDNKALIITNNKLVELEPSNLESLKKLEELHEDPEELKKVYNLMLNNDLEQYDKVETLYKVATLYKADNPETAEGYYKSILEEDDVEKKDAYLELIEYYKATENWEALVENYENFIEEHGGDLEEEELISYYDKLASIYYDEDKLNMPKKATEKYLASLNIDSQLLKSLFRLKKLFKADEDSRSELFDIMKQLNSALEQGNEDLQGGYESSIIDEAKTLGVDIKSELLNNYNEFEDFLIEDGEFDEVIELGIKHLELFPQDKGIVLKLEKVYESQEMYDDLLTILDKKLELTEDKEERIAIFRKIATVSMDKLGDPERTTEAYNAILAIDSTDLDSIENLESLYKRLENWEDLIPLLELKLKSAENTRPIYLDIINTYSENLGNYNDAYRYILISLEKFKDDEEFLNLLDSVGNLSMDWEDYIVNTDKAIELLTNSELKNRYKFRVAKVYKDELGDFDNAILRYENLLQDLPQNREILDNLESLYSQEAKWDKLSNILEKIILLEEDLDLKKDYFYKLGSHYEENLEDLNKATETFERLHKTYPTEMDALEQLERLYLDLDDKKSLVHVYNSKINLIDYPEEKIELWYQIEQIGKEIENKPLQIRAYEEILKLDENNEEAFTSLETELTEAEEWKKLIENIDYLVEKESNMKNELLYKKAKILEEKLEDKAVAISLYSNLVLGGEVEDKRAVNKLINLYKSEDKSEELVTVYKTLLDKEEDKDDRVQYLNSLAQIYHKDDNIEDAQTYYEYSLGEESNNDIAIDGLTSIFESKEQWNELIEHLLSVASSQDEEKASELYYKSGNIYLEKLNEIDNAKNSFELAVNSKYDHKDAIIKLKNIALDMEEYDSVTNYLEELRNLTEDADELVKINNELGYITIEKLEEPGSAVYAYEASMEAKANYKAALNLSNLYFETEDYESLNNLYKDHFELVIENDRKNREKHYYRNAFVQNSLEDGDIESIYNNSMQAFKLNAIHYENLNLLYDVSHKTKNFETLVKVSKQMLLHYFDKYKVKKLGDIYVKLGIAYSALKDFDKSSKYFNKTLAIDEFNVNALKHAVEAYKTAAQWPKVIEYLNKILKREEDQDEKLKIYFEMALIYKDHMKNYPKALGFFNQLVKNNVRTRKIYDHMLEIYYAQDDKKNILTLSIEISKMEQNKEEKEKLYYKIAELYHGSFNDSKNALSYLIKILESNYQNTKVLSTIEKLLEPTNNLKDLEAIYKKVLSNTPKEKKELRFYILEKLAIIYKDKFQDYKKAISVYEELLSLSPNNKKYQDILIDFYERIPEFYHKAIKLHKEVLAKNYNDFNSHHSLIRLYNEQKAYDKAFCHTAFLSVKNESTEDEEKFYQGYKPITIAKPYQSLTTLSLEKYVYPKALSRELNSVFASFSGLIADFMKIKHVKKIKDINFKKDKLPAGTRFDNLSNNIMNSLGLVGNEIYVSGTARGLRLENTRPATIIVGRDLLQDRDDLEAAFFLTRHLFFALPEFYLINISKSVGYDVYELFNVILSLFTSVQVSDKNLLKLQKYLNKNIPSDAAALINKLSQKGSIDLNKWLNGVELAANRVALLLSGDIKRALKALQEDKHSFSRIKPSDKFEDLLRYSISDKYMEFRENLGVSIKIK